jgi:hemolysin III
MTMTLSVKRPREPANGVTHLVGMGLAIPALIVLAAIGVRSGEPRAVVSLILFGLSQLALYTASALYHSLTLSPAAADRLERLDCSMVLLFIAGAYTPLCLLALHGIARWALLGTVWALALGGLITMARWMEAPRWASTGFYAALGWIGLLAAPAIFGALPAAGVVWLLAGGAVYTFGAVIFLLERPNPAPGVFEAHAIWHLCVLGGSACIFWLIVRYVAPLA